MSNLSKEKLNECISNLVYDGKRCYNQLSDEELNEVAGLIMECTPKTYVYEYMLDADFKHEIPYMIAKYMQTKNKELGEAILEQFCKNARVFAQKEIELLIDEKILLQREANEYRSKFDPEHDYS